MTEGAKPKNDWVTAGACLGFLLLGGVALGADVAVEQIFLRASVGAFVGWLLGHAMKFIPEPKAPRQVWTVNAPLDLREFERDPALDSDPPY
ncbi:MAG TPA: hypothetical protein DD435_00115 [Cyanobacteria bacterium UBA8530]|nr:hypothetical protein [Cyanobacteria bacterium UBA8530]